MNKEFYESKRFLNCINKMGGTVLVGGCTRSNLLETVCCCAVGFKNRISDVFSSVCDLVYDFGNSFAELHTDSISLNIRCEHFFVANSDNTISYNLSCLDNGYIYSVIYFVYTYVLQKLDLDYLLGRFFDFPAMTVELLQNTILFLNSTTKVIRLLRLVLYVKMPLLKLLMFLLTVYLLQHPLMLLARISYRTVVPSKSVLIMSITPLSLSPYWLTTALISFLLLTKLPLIALMLWTNVTMFPILTAHYQPVLTNRYIVAFGHIQTAAGIIAI